MKIQLRVEGFNLVQGTHEGVRKRIEEIAHIFPEDTVFHVTIKRKSNSYKTLIKVQNGRSFIRGEASGKKIEYSIASAVKVLKKRVRKLKEMSIDKKRKTFIDIKDIVEEVDTKAKQDLGIERIKNINIPLISEIDAIMDLEALDHDFYIFKNIEKEGRVCVLYRRDIGYGLIVTE